MLTRGVCAFLRAVAGKEKLSSIEELKMIHSGKLLDNNKSFADYKIPTTNQVLANAFFNLPFEKITTSTVYLKPHTLHSMP